MSNLKRELALLGGDVETALQTIHIPAALFDLDGVILWQNEASVALRGPIAQLSLLELVPTSERPSVHAALRTVAEASRTVAFDLQVRNGDGTPVWIRLSASPILAGKTVVGIFGVSTPGVDEPVRERRRLASGLTLRQLEIVRLLAGGLGTAEIAMKLSLSPATVRNHIANLIAALDVHTRLQAVIAAKEAGLLES